MKPKYQRLMRRAFPSLIVLPAMAAQIASAALFEPDTAGNILVPSNFSTINGQGFTLVADGGTGSTYTAIIEAGVIFTGDAVQQDGMQITVGNYTVTNGGSLTGAQRGIEASAPFTLINNGTIEGLANEGINSVGGITNITNNTGGLIRGGDDGVYFNTDGGTVTNYGTITGLNNSQGINAADDLVVTNYGSISGGGNGIDAVNDALVDNYGSISGTNGVDLLDGGTITNLTTFNFDGSVASAGSITGTVNGIDVAADTKVDNNITALIQGGTNGVDATSGLDLDNYGGQIIGVSGIGVDAGSNSSVFNDNDTDGAGNFHEGVIRGGTDGVNLLDNSYVGNNGTIEGVLGSGVVLGDGPGTNGYNIYNTGEILGRNAAVIAGNDIYIENRGLIRSSLSVGIVAEADFSLLVDGNGSVEGVGGILTNGGGADLDIQGLIYGSGGTAMNLGNTGGVGGNLITLSDEAHIDGNITSSGTGNSITASYGVIDGDVTGIQNITVQPSGYLYLFGDILSPTSIAVSGSGGLSGSGAWQADIGVGGAGAAIYAGVSSSDFYQGILSISGNVTHSVGSRIVTGIDPLGAITNNGTNAGLIRSTSGIYNAVPATIDLFGQSNYALRDGTYVIVEDAGGTVLGAADDISYYGYYASTLSEFFASSRIDGGGSLVVDIQHDYSGLPGLSDNQQAAGAALDAFMAEESALPDGVTNDGDLRYQIGIADYYGLDYVQGLLNSMIAPAEATLALTQSLVNSNYRLNRLVQNHLAAARSADTVSVPVGMTSSKDAAPAPASYARKAIVWGSLSYDWQDYEGDGDYSDFDGEVSAFTAGFDYRVAPNFILGGLIDGSQADTDNSVESVDIESLRIALYGTYGGSTGFYTDFLLGYGDHGSDFTDATSWQASVTVGYTLGTTELKHGPFAGLEYQKVDVDGYGVDGILSTEVDDFDVDSFRALIGYRVNGDFGRFKPYASIAYAHEFEDGGNSVTTSFSSVSFRVTGGEQGSAIVLTAGTGIVLTPALTLDLGYRGEICVESEGMDSHGGNLGLNWAF